MTLANLMKTIKERKAKANPANTAKNSVWDAQSLAVLAKLAASVIPNRLNDDEQIPIIQVKCVDCAHFTRDKIGDGSGIGTCTLGIRWTQQVHGRMPLYPNVLSYCPQSNKQDVTI